MRHREGQPPTDTVREARAARIDHAAFQYRRHFRLAYGNGFAPYAHMTRHLGDAQRRVQWDLHRYNGQAQEHYGKIAKTTVTKQTNFRLGKKNKQGKYTPSYIQQMVEKMVHRKKLMEAVKVRP